MNKKHTPPRTSSSQERESKKKNAILMPSADNRFVRKAQEDAPASRKRTSKKGTAPQVQPAVTDEVLEEVLVEVAENTAVPTDTESGRKSFSQRRREWKEAKGDIPADITKSVCKQHGLTEDDLAMIFELGYESELGKLVGYDTLKRLKHEYRKRTHQSDGKQYRTAFGYRGAEYDGTTAREAVLSAYSHDRKRLILRTVLTALCTLLLLIVENPSSAGTLLTRYTAPLPLLLPIVGILLLVGCAALSYRQILAGLRSFFRFETTPYSVCAVLLPFSLIYDLLCLFTTTRMLPVNFLSACALLVTACCDVIRLAGEITAFRIASAEESKSVLQTPEPRKKKLRRGERIVKVLNDDEGECMYRVTGAEQTSGFFRRCNDMTSAARPFNVCIIAALSLATLLAFADAVYTSSIASALSAFMTVLFISLPCSAVFGYFYPLFRANRLLAKHRCALLGNEAVDEYDCRKTVIFREYNLFDAQKQTEVSIREDSDFRRDFQLCGTLFRKLGGAIGDIILKPRTVREDPPVSIVRVTESGVEAMVDNRYHMLAGNDEFLRRNGIEVEKESTDKALRRTPNVSLLYVAVDGVLKLSFEIEYNCKPEFERIITDLAYSDTIVGLHTYDPNLNDAFTPLCRPRRTDPVRIIKPVRYDEPGDVDIADTGAVALEDPLDIVYPIHAAAGVGMARRFGIRMQLISALAGSLAAVLLTVFGYTQFLTVFSIAAYQLFWIAISLFASHSELNRGTLRFRK